MANYSHSKISTFEQCRYKYKLRYIDKVKVEGGYGIEAFMGSTVHDTLEQLYAVLKTGKVLTIEELIQTYNRKWQEKYNEEEIVIVKKNMTAEDYQRMGEQFLLHYYNRYKPFNQGMTIGLETTEFLDLDGRNKYHVRIDRLTKNGDVIEIHDYKTNSRLPTQQKIDEDRQLAMYSLWVKDRFKDAKDVKLIWHFLAFDTEMTTDRSEEQLQQMKEEVILKIKTIEEAKEFPVNVSRLCDWCEYQEMCPAWKHKFEKEEEKKERNEEKEQKKEQETLQEQESVSGDELVDTYVKTKEQIDELSEKLDKIKEAILKYADENELSAVFGTNKKALIKELSISSWPRKHTEEREELVKILKDMGIYEHASDLDPSALTTIISELEKDKAEKIKDFEVIHKVKRMTLSRL